MRELWSPEEFAFFRDELPAPPARVLEVGCGAGELAVALSAAGYDVTAIDPEAPAGPLFRRERIEEHEGGPYDAVVAARSLHHVHELDSVVERIAGLAPLFLLAELAWERLDDATAAWLDGERARLPDPEAPGAADWVEKHRHLHRGEEMLAALERRFSERSLIWRPYLLRYLGVADDAAEREAIDAGLIRPLGFCYGGSTRALPGPSG